MSHTSDWLTKNIETILEGGKVSLDTDDRQHDWLYNTVHTMYQKDMITEEPECFFNLLQDHEHPTLSLEKISKFKGDTSLHAISFRMSEQHEKYAELLDSQKGFYLAGLRQHDKWPDHKPIIVPALGDIRVLSQMHDTLLYRLENAEEHANIQETKRPVEVKRPIYIDNSEGLWTSYLNKAFTPDELKLITENGVHITTSDDQLKTKIEKSLSNIPDKPEESAPEGAVILFNTSNNKKIHELRAIFDLIGVKATVIPFGLSGVRAKEAEEVSHTYSGNNAEKLNHAADAIQAVDIGDLKKNLARFGVDMKNAYILSEDRGLAVLEDLLSGPEFDGYQELINPYRPQPGVELAHLLKGMSIKEFYEKLKVSAERKGLGNQGIEVQDIVSYQLRPLDGRANKPSINAFGITRNVLDFDLYEDKSRAVYSEDYVRALDAPKGQPNSAIQDYIEKYSAVAKAVQALVSAAGFKADLDVSREANQKFDTQNKDDFSVITQSSAIAKIGH
ncbi:MAG: hypothetical protein JKY11_00310, partial [Alphaproteobacteria bacterium]|nr:hypothetical protein [Alphaproteobacteria bacterium]